MPDDEFLAAYAAGSLDPRLQLMGRLHEEMCPSGRCSLALGDAIASSYFDKVTPVALEPACLSVVLSKIEHLTEEASVVPQPACSFDASELPHAVRDLVAQSEMTSPWTSIAEGCDLLMLSVVDGEDDTTSSVDLSLLHARPGATMGEHVHECLEFSLVLKGKVADENGEYGPGDFYLYRPQTKHTPCACEGEACFVLSATVRN